MKCALKNYATTNIDIDQEKKSKLKKAFLLTERLSNNK